MQKLLKKLADETEGNFAFEYSPESFTGTEPEYIGGKTIAVTLTEEGLKRISNWAAADAEETTKEIYFYYTAVVK